jgi:hypothetical protein
MLAAKRTFYHQLFNLTTIHGVVKRQIDGNENHISSPYLAAGRQGLTESPGPPAYGPDPRFRANE